MSGHTQGLKGDTAGDELRNRSDAFFEALYYELTDRYKSFLSDSRTLGLTVKELYIVDSTTIRLFSVTRSMLILDASIIEKDFMHLAFPGMLFFRILSLKYDDGINSTVYLY